MPIWTTHTEGGSWSGGGTEVPDCNQRQRNMIIAAYNNFINANCLNCFPGLEADLRAAWDNMEIDCTDEDCDGTLIGRTYYGLFGPKRLLICPNRFNGGQNAINATLLHEMVHWAGGSELDSEAVERACFGGNGATVPAGDDWDKFFDDTDSFNGDDSVRKGEYVIWDSNTGEVWGIEVEGGSWSSSGEEVKGDLCFQDVNNWIHNDPGGGW